MNTKPDKNTAVPDAEAYKNLVDLMAVHSEATARMGELENDLQQSWLDLVDARRRDYADLQALLGRTEEAIETAARMNPQWFEKSKTLKTPYGRVAFRSVPSLDVPNEEVSILLLEQLGQDGLPFIRMEKHLNLEALEKMDDTELERLRIKRVKTETCKVTPARVDLGKAVKEAAKAAGKGGEP